jgi:predicted ATPase
MQSAEAFTVAGVSTGTRAFLFTDIAGSTQLWERLPDAMTLALEQHDAILRDAIETARGQVVKATGDGLMAVFPTAADGVVAGLAIQRGLVAATWSETGPLRVRIGLHVGDAERRGDDYFGPTVNRTARIMAAGHGGQVLLSAAAAALAADDLPDGASLRDLGEYRLKDLGRPERIFQLVHPALVSTFPPLSTLDHSAGNLPLRGTPFVGRRAELDDVERRLADDAVRLLTLTGPGGTGKTSLAIQAAADQQERFRDGVSFVDLSAARDGAGMVIALGRAVGVAEAPDRALLADVTDRLRDRQMLLLLDNFEQVTTAAPMATQLLSDCPEIKLLVTSREPLHVRLEHIYPVPPLGLPPEDRGRASVEQYEGFEAIALFVERARTVRPDFRLDDDNAAAVVEICRRLDGLPLAIELAAARLRLLSPEALRDRLGRRLELLRSSSRDLPERQQTLRATIEWSYQLLEPGEQRVFESLAVFADADVSAVEAAIAATDAVAGTEVDVIEALASLVEKSLVRQVDPPHGEPRLRMLETIHEYATDRLDAGPLGPAVRRAHATHYAELAGRLREQLVGSERDQAMTAMATEVGNLRVAWRFWTTESDLGQLTKLADSLLILNEARGWYHDCVLLTTDLLAVLARTTSTPELVGKEIAIRLVLARALMATQGLTPEVAAAYEQVLRLFEDGDQDRQQYWVLRGLANVYMLRTEFGKSQELGRRILELGEQEDDPNMRIDGHLIIGATSAFEGDLMTGLDHLDAAIGLFEPSPARTFRSRVGNDPRVASLTTFAFGLWLAGKPDVALEHANAAIDLARQLDHPYTLAYAQFHSGLLHWWRREPDLALDRAIRLLEIADEYDFRIWSAVGACLQGAALVALGQVTTGLARVAEGMAAYQGLAAPPVFWPLLQFVSAGANLVAGQPAGGLEPIEAAIEMTTSDGGTGGILGAEMQLLRGDILAALEVEAVAGSAAEAAYETALDISRAVGVRMSELRAATRLSRSAPPESRARRLHDLRSVYDTFTEGFTTADLLEAREALDAG